MAYLGNVPAVLPVDGSELGDGTITNAKLASGITSSKLLFDTTIIPSTNDSIDIGSSAYKVRDMFISDTSLWVGDDHRVSISGGKMKFKKRKKSQVPTLITAAGGNEGAALAHAGRGSLTAMTTHDWLSYRRTFNPAAKIEDVFHDENDFDSENKSGITAGVYGSATGIPILTIDEDGKVTTVTTATPVAQTANDFTNALKSKLDAIEASATADQTAAQIKTHLENGIDSVHYVDGSIDVAHMSANSVDSAQYVDGSIDTVHIADSQITQAKMASNAVTTAIIADDAVTAAKIANSINTDIATGVTAGTTASAALPKAGGTMTGDILHAGNFTINTDGNIALDNGSNNLVLLKDGAQYGILAASGGNLVIKSGATTAVTFANAAATFASTVVTQGNLTTNGNLKVSTLPSTTVNAEVPILFRPADGWIAGDSAMSWNPAGDYMNINGTIISSNYIRSTGSNPMKLGSANGGHIMSLTTDGNLLVDTIGTAVTGGHGKLTIMHNSRGGSSAEDTAALKIQAPEDDTTMIFGTDGSGNYSFIQSYHDAITWPNRPLILQQNGGRVGIGTSSPSAAFEVSGNCVVSGEVHSASDIALKENIVPITNAINKLKEISGIIFNKIGEKKRSTGVIAQDVEKVLPEAVRDGPYKSVAYGNMVGLLVEAIKEQQTQIDDLKKEIENGK